MRYQADFQYRAWTQAGLQIRTAASDFLYFLLYIYNRHKVKAELAESHTLGKQNTILIPKVSQVHAQPKQNLFYR